MTSETDIDPIKVTEILEKAQLFDIDPVVRRYMTKRLVTAEHARRVADEMLRYLSLCAAYPEGQWTVTGEVDDMWHTFILFTQRYNEFCGSVAGGYIHHVPSEEPNSVEDPLERLQAGRTRAMLPGKYKRTLAAYRKAMGIDPDPVVWPSPLVFDRPQDPQACNPSGGGGKPREVCGCGPLKDPPSGPPGWWDRK